MTAIFNCPITTTTRKNTTNWRHATWLWTLLSPKLSTVNYKHLMAQVPREKVNFVSRESSRFGGNKIHCFLRDQSLSDLFYCNTETQYNRVWKTRRALEVNINRNIIVPPFDTVWSRALAGNSKNVARFSKCCPLMDVWRETVCLLVVMWPWINQWTRAFHWEKRQL